MVSGTVSMAAVGTFAAQGRGHEAVDSGFSGGTVEAPSDRLKGMQMMSLETASGVRCVACPISADSSTGAGSLADVVWAGVISDSTDPSPVENRCGGRPNGQAAHLAAVHRSGLLR